jgi:hypothetical protein
MLATRVALIGMLLAAAAGTAEAQQTSVDVSRLPVDLVKVTRQLRQTTGSESRQGLHIRYTVDVYGAAPSIEFFTKKDNLATGPVPYGAPGHREMIEHVTPIEYRAPAADFSALLRWLGDRDRKK